MRDAIDPRPGMRVLDAGCGVGLEAARLASEHPDVHVTGVDRNAEMLEIARRRAPEVEWVEADLTDLDLEPEFDAVRTERVLIHVPEVESVVDNLIGVLAPGGRLALFELDYGGTILAPGADEEVADRVAETLYASLEQPQAGRLLPGLLSRARDHRRRRHAVLVHAQRAGVAADRQGHRAGGSAGAGSRGLARTADGRGRERRVRGRVRRRAHGRYAAMTRRASFPGRR